MDRVITPGTVRVRERTLAASPTRQAYQILHFGFTVAPAVAGIDKFFHLLTNWDQYLYAPIASSVGLSAHSFMNIIGVVEIAAALLVALWPRVGGYVLAAWMLGIIVNLALVGSFFDVALRDLGLMLGALALARLATVEDRPIVRERRIESTTTTPVV